MSGGGKWDDNGPVIRSSEVQDPWDQLARRMEALGASPEVIADVRVAFRRGRTEIRHMTDGHLAANIAGLMAGTGNGWIAADKAVIEAARRDEGLWADANEVVASTIPRVMAWVGTDAGRAVVAHEAELRRVEDLSDGPRRKLVAWLKAIHGQNDIEDPVA